MVCGIIGVVTRDSVTVYQNSKEREKQEESDRSYSCRVLKRLVGVYVTFLISWIRWRIVN